MQVIESAGDKHSSLHQDFCSRLHFGTESSFNQPHSVYTAFSMALRDMLFPDLEEEFELERPRLEG